MRILSQIGRGGATSRGALTPVGAPAYFGTRRSPSEEWSRRPVTLTAVADALLAAAWIGLAIDNLRVARSDGGAPAARGNRPAARWAVLGVLLVGAGLLEL